MSTSSLVGRKLKISGNDFTAEDVTGTVSKISKAERKILVEIIPPMVVSGTSYPYLIASPRLAADDLDRVLSVGVLGCSVTWIPFGVYDERHPFDLSWWRGGAAAVADLTLE